MKKKLCHSIYCSCRTQEHLPSVPRSPMTMLILLCPVQYNNSLFVHSGTVSGHACFWSECFRTYRTLKGWRAERFALKFSTSPFNSTILAGQNASSQLSILRDPNGMILANSFQMNYECCNDCKKLSVMEALASSLNDEIKQIKTRLQQQWIQIRNK